MDYCNMQHVPLNISLEVTWKLQVVQDAASMVLKHANMRYLLHELVKAPDETQGSGYNL